MGVFHFCMKNARKKLDFCKFLTFIRKKFSTSILSKTLVLIWKRTTILIEYQNGVQTRGEWGFTLYIGGVHFCPGVQIM